MQFFLKKYLISIALLLLLGSCSHTHQNPAEVIIEKRIYVDEEISKIIRSQVIQFEQDSMLIIDNDTIITASTICNYFSNNDYKPIWTTQEQLSIIGKELLQVLDSLNWHGLFSESYNVFYLHQKISQISNSDTSKINITRLYELNILLTNNFLKIITDLRDGSINPETLKREWKIKNGDTSLISFLNSAVNLNDIQSVISSVDSKKPQYVLLKKYLRDNLILSDQYKKMNDTTSLDSLNKNTVVILTNMERWRWETDPVSDHRIEINVPSYELTFFAYDTIALTSKIICGKPDTPSPYRLDSRINYYYVYPYWIIPFSIATKEILPKLKINPSYLTKNNIQVLDRRGNIVTDTIEWKKYSVKRFPFTLRQRDGDENTLGMLKFIFPNKYGIYLHDTNAPGLFKKEMRALSHGCIRLEKARQLASIISDCCSRNFNKDSLELYISKKERHRINLDIQIPIQLRYYTAIADSSGIHFYNDIYSIDSLIGSSYRDLNLHDNALKQDL